MVFGHSQFQTDVAKIGMQLYMLCGSEKYGTPKGSTSM